MQIKSKEKREENHVVYVYVDRSNFACEYRHLNFNRHVKTCEYKADLINMTRLDGGESTIHLILNLFFLDYFIKKIKQKSFIFLNRFQIFKAII